MAAFCERCGREIEGPLPLSNGNPLCPRHWGTEERSPQTDAKESPQRSRSWGGYDYDALEDLPGGEGS